MVSSKKRGQTAIEYIMIIGGAILFVAIVVLILRQLTNLQEEGITNKTAALGDCYLRPGVMFFDNFDSGSTERWKPISGTWEMRNGKYAQTGAAVGSISVIKAQKFSNFTMEFKMRITFSPVSNKRAGVAFHWNSSSYYYLTLMTSNLGPSTVSTLYRFNVPTSSSIFTYTTFEPLLYGNEAAIKINVKENNVKVYWDNRPIIDTTLPIPIRTDGQVGFYTNAVMAEFDDICVYQE